MALIPYEPFQQLENMRREMDRLFSDDRGFFPVSMAQQFGYIRIDLKENEQELIAECEIPGLENKEDVRIDVGDQILTISGTIKKDSETSNEQIHRQERFRGSFRRSIALPSNVSPEGVKAVYKNGVLEIRMPKVESGGQRSVDIEFH